ncbi:hypothetical protein [Shewanella oncorhynchi]|uniref:hypothetical protein n=1 Tax=Shewanella oncorhynchi TaxID=2726434 RepID=UPI003D7ABC93
MNELKIKVGPLSSIASVYSSTVSQLEEFNNAWKLGTLPIIEWDLSDIRTGHINVAAASFFLALAHRVRQFTNESQPIKIDWHPKTFSFLEDINFFQVANEYDLFDWPYEIGGYDDGLINPNTKILAYDKISIKPNLKKPDEVSEWKKSHREAYRRNIIDKCEALFIDNDNFNNSKDLPLIISRTCAEMATNSLLWGESAAFLGLQRSRNMIFISVSDIGLGFKNSFISKNEHVEFLKNTTVDKDIASLAIGSVINKNEFGIKRAISTVLELGGNITISSGKGEIQWGRTLWNRYLEDIENKKLYKAIESLPESINKSDLDEKINGFSRKWSASIRGTRVSFTIPLGGRS